MSLRMNIVITYANIDVNGVTRGKWHDKQVA